jgi:tetratricopeptide (TPR) repeat protein
MTATSLVVLLALAQAEQAAFERAAAALRQGDYRRAEDGFRAILDKNPKHLPALGNLGVVYSQTRRYERAIEIYHKALALAPGNAQLELNLGIAYVKQDRCREALPHLENAAAGDAPKIQVGELLAACYTHSNQPERAAKVLAGLVGAAAPAQAHFLMGRARYELAEFEEARKELERAAALDPRLAGLARELGKVYVSLRGAADAERWLRRAVEQDSGDTEARYFLGALLLTLDKIEEAKALLESVERDRPQFWGAHYYLGKLLLGSGKPAESVAHLEMAAKLRPDEPAVLYQLARALQGAGRNQESEAALRRLSQLRAKAAADELDLLRRP